MKLLERNGWRLLFFLDASTPESVAVCLEQAGHDVIRHHDVLSEGAPDPVVCETALKHGAVLIAVDNDMKRLTRRFNPEVDRFKHLSVIHIDCKAVMAAKRIQYALSLIEHENEVCGRKAAGRLWIIITNHTMITHR